MRRKIQLRLHAAGPGNGTTNTLRPFRPRQVLPGFRRGHVSYPKQLSYAGQIICSSWLLQGRFCPNGGTGVRTSDGVHGLPVHQCAAEAAIPEGESLSRNYYGQGDRKTPINARTGNYEYREEVWELSTFALLFREFVVLVGLKAAGKAKHPFFQGFAHPGEYVPASFLQAFLGRFGKCIEDGLRALTQCRGRSQ
jgi:hypothetical protein